MSEKTIVANAINENNITSEYLKNVLERSRNFVLTEKRISEIQKDVITFMNFSNEDKKLMWENSYRY